GGRYQIHELLRQYAGEKLAANATALAEAQNRHMAYFADFLRENEPELKSEAQLDALQAIDGELDNIRVAWRRTVGQRRLSRRQWAPFCSTIRCAAGCAKGWSCFEQRRRRLLRRAICWGLSYSFLRRGSTPGCYRRRIRAPGSTARRLIRCSNWKRTSRWPCRWLFSPGPQGCSTK